MTKDAGAVYVPYIPLQTGPSTKWEKIPQIKVHPNEWNVYGMTDYSIALWIENQPDHMWERAFDAGEVRYRISSELESWFLLRWL